MQRSVVFLKKTVRDRKVSHFCEKKSCKSVTLWEHLPNIYYWIIIQPRRKKWDTLGCNEKIFFLYFWLD